MDFGEIAAIFAIVSPIIWKLTDFLKYARAKDVNATVTQAVVWVGGILLLFLLSRTDFASALAVGQTTFDRINGPTLIFIGLAGGSLSSGIYDFKKARDSSQSAATPALIPEGVVVVDSATGAEVTRAS